MVSPFSRRHFLGATIALAACQKKFGPTSDTAPKDGDIPLPPPPVTTAAMPTRQLGKTGVTVSRIGLGGAHIGKQSEEQESIRIIRSAIDRGVTFLDNSWDYNGGKSEERMGKALRDGYREKAFLMTKLDGRTKAAAAGQLEQSLRRLQTDHIDLVQVHEVIRFTDPARVFGEGGAIEALVEARKAGKLRFIGFTGHKSPDIHLAMLKAADDHGFAFDTIQMPLNVMDAHYESFEKKVLPVAAQKGMGILHMKPLGGGFILESKTATAMECLRYAMNLPTSVMITGCDSMGVLDQAVQAAIEFKPMTADEVQALLARTAGAAAGGKFERFKTSEYFDSTAKNPKWLEEAKI
ncbi:MAG TPA: aldo/keto reductase [Polyangiaceae bacterium]|jgi:aryl-alcohol dehydrogenase-like predicted oxidoreductase